MAVTINGVAPTTAQKNAFRTEMGLASVDGAGNTRGLLAAAIGDSRLANSLQNQSTGVPQARINWSNQGSLFWFNFLTYQKVKLPPAYDLAVSGYTTAQIAGLVDAVIALNPRPSLCFINGGTNSFSVAATREQVLQSLADTTGAALRLRASGVEPVIETDAPRTLASWNADAQKCSAAYNRLLRQWCRDAGVRCADTEAMMVQSVGGAAGDPVVGYNITDGVHQAATGAIVRGLAYQSALDGLILSSPGQQTSTPVDLWDASINPGGNMLTNGLLTGTGGSNSGTGASGTVSSSWTNQVVSGTATSVASKESPRSDGSMGDVCVQTISATTAAQTRFAPTTSLVTTGKLSSGDIVFGEIDLEISDISGVVEYAHLNIFDFDGAATGSLSVAGKQTFSAGLNPLPTLPLPRNTTGTLLSTLRGRLRTAPVVIGQGITSTTLIFRAECGLGASSSATLKWGDATLRKSI